MVAAAAGASDRHVWRASTPPWSVCRRAIRCGSARRRCSRWRPTRPTCAPSTGCSPAPARASAGRRATTSRSPASPRPASSPPRAWVGSRCPCGCRTSSAATVVPGAVAAPRAVVAAGLSKRAYHRRGLRYHGRVVAVWGDHDRLVPPGHSVGVAAAVPQAEIEVWPGMGHHPQCERLTGCSRCCRA